MLLKSRTSAFWSRVSRREVRSLPIESTGFGGSGGAWRDAFAAEGGRAELRAVAPSRDLALGFFFAGVLEGIEPVDLALAVDKRRGGPPLRAR